MTVNSVSAAAASLALLAAGCVPSPEAAKTASTAPATSPSFSQLLEIHQDKWMALHLFAYHSAVDLSDKRVRGRFAKDPIDAALITGELAEEFAPLAAAYEPYIGMHPLFDDELAQIGVHLLQNGVETLPDERLRKALVDFMPLYEQHFASRHRALVDEMAGSIRRQVDEDGDATAAELSRILGGEWGSDPVRLDIIPYVSRAGAFTARSWRWIVMSAVDETNRAHAYELVFHESSHMSPIGDAIRPAAEAALAAHGLDNDRFWHFLLWYASGEAVKPVLGDDYVTYSEAVGLRDREGNKIYFDAMDATWDQHDTLEARAYAAAAWVAARQAAAQ